nr:hypothetical protein [Tanacetum cinerariifolium]
MNWFRELKSSNDSKRDIELLLMVKWKDGRERVSLASATSTCAPR